MIDPQIAERLPADARLELKQLSLEIAGLNARAQDLVGICGQHAVEALAGCDDCKPLYTALVQLNRAHQRYHFALNRAMFAVTAQSFESGVPLKPVQPAKGSRAWWRRFITRPPAVTANRDGSPSSHGDGSESRMG